MNILAHSSFLSIYLYLEFSIIKNLLKVPGVQVRYWVPVVTSQLETETDSFSSGVLGQPRLRSKTPS